MLCLGKREAGVESGGDVPKKNESPIGILFYIFYILAIYKCM